MIGKVETTVIIEEREEFIGNVVVSPRLCFKIAAKPQMNNHKKKHTLPIFKMAAIEADSKTPLFSSKLKLKSIEEEKPHIETVIVNLL